jgi:hypothetical protein
MRQRRSDERAQRKSDFVGVVVLIAFGVAIVALASVR